MLAGSLFSDIGGLDLAVEAVTGARTVWQVERDEWCRGVLAQHWPEAQRFDDVCSVGEELERVDIIAGGFPCQDVSLAGKRAGLAGERSGLWSEFARIVRVVRPRFVLVENVAGLLSMEFGQVLGDLAALGFDAEWGVFRASDAGAPHRRERVFILAVADASGVDGERVERRGGGSRRPVWTAGVCGCGEAVADAECGHAQRRRGAGVMDGARGVTQSEGHERQRGGDAARGGGEAVGVAVADAERIEGIERHDADVLGRRSGNAEQARVGCGMGDAAGARCEGHGSGRAQPRLGGVADGLPRGMDAHRWPAGRGEEQHEWEAPRVAKAAPERRHRLKALGNAVVPQQAALALRVLAARLGVDFSHDTVTR